MLDFSSSYFGQSQVVPMVSRTVVLYGKVVDGSYVPTMPVAAATIELAQSPTVLKVSLAKKTMTYGTPLVVTGVLADKAGAGAAGQSIALQQKLTGKWITVAGTSAVTGSGGAFTVKIDPTSNAQYRFVFAGSDTLAATSSSVIKVNVKAKLSMPAAAVSARKVTVSGKVLPAHSASLRLYFERKVSGKYRSYKSIVVKTGSSGAYKKTTSLPRGTWRVRVRHSDTGHVSGYSAWRGFSVR